MIEQLEESEFLAFQKIIFSEIGIELSASKKLFVQSRLLKRLLHYEIDSYVDYLRFVQIDENEKREMINLITTNETYFFREMDHFDYLKDNILPWYAQKREKFRFWSAASSIGAEAYSAAMILDSVLSKDSWEIIGTDINSEVIKKARVGLYPESWIDKIPQELKKKYCLKGKGRHEGYFLVDRELVANMSFKIHNLLKINQEVGLFDVIFLRNVLIYFNDETKQRVVDNVIKNLKIGGYFFISLTFIRSH